jgi:hypothetical protein
MSWHDRHLIAQRPQLLLDRIHQLLMIATGKIGTTNTPIE